MSMVCYLVLDSRRSPRRPLKEATKAFTATGKKRDLVDELRKWFPYSREYIRDLLGPDFKDEVKAAAGRWGSGASSATPRKCRILH